MRKRIFIVAMATAMLLSLGAISSMADGGVETDTVRVTSGTKEVDSIDTKKSEGAVAEPDTSGSPDATINVTKDVKVEPPTSSTSGTEGIKAVAEDKEKAEVNVGKGGSGDVTVTDRTDSSNSTTGVTVHASATTHNSSASASVKGNVNVTRENSINGDTTGIKVRSHENDSEGNATTSVDVTGSVNVTGAKTAIGIKVDDSDFSNTNGDNTVKVGKDLTVKAGEGATATGIDVLATGDVTDIEVGKNLTVTGGDGTSGIKISDDNNNTTKSTVKVTVKGDVDSSDDGIVIETEKGDKIDVVIEGTLKADGNAIDLKNPEEDTDSNLSITAWKIESDNNMVTVNGGANASDAQKAVAEKVEKSINYILRIDKNSASNVSFTGNNITEINGWDTAHAGANVAIKLNTPDGFRVKNLYRDKSNNVKLEEGNDGNYYLVVPSGGGVWVSLELEKIPDPVTPVDPVDPVDPVNPVVPSEPSDNDDSSSDHSYLDRNINISTLSDSDMSFDEKEGILTITIPKGMNAFYLDSSVLLAFKAKGLKILNLDTTSGKYSIPLTSIDDIVKEGNLLAFVIRIEKVDIYINGLLTREFYRDKVA